MCQSAALRRDLGERTLKLKTNIRMALADWLQQSLRVFPSCGLRLALAVVVWGGSATSANADAGLPSTRAADKGRITAMLDAGGNFTCALRPDATLACWGQSLGNLRPAPAGGLIAVAGGAMHAC